jgi:thioesterase domain-containing protein
VRGQLRFQPPDRRPGRGGARPPLFFAHTIAGDVLFVRQFLPYLAPDQPLYGFRARGLDGIDQPHRRIEDMAADFAQLIRQVQPRGPYFLAGLCDGSLTAVETARILRAAGEEVGFVGLIDPRTNPVESPWLYWRQPDLPRIRLWRQVLRKLQRLKRKLGPLVGWYPALDAIELPVDGPEMARRRQAIRVGMTEALAAYRPQPYEGEIAIFASAVRVAEIGRRSPGWQALARRCDVITVANSHIQVMAGALPLLASRLRDKLEGAQAAASR